MKKNQITIIFVLVAIFFLYLASKKLGNHGLKKSISACIYAQKQKNKSITILEAEKYCKKEIKKKLQDD